MSKKQLISKRGKWQVVLHDDDRVTVDHVVKCLMDVCAHSYIQSVQCATIVHNCGKYTVFIDTWDECEDVRQDLHDLGLTVTISKYKKNV